MYLLDDIDSFEPKATKILAQGLPPICDHGGFNDGHFCCLNCSTPLFDKDDLWLEGALLYSFRRPLSLDLFEFSFDASCLYPKTCIHCLACGHSVGYIQSSLSKEEKIFYIFSRSVYLQNKSIPDSH